MQALPLFSLLLPMHTGEGNAPPAPPPLTRWGGGSWLLLLHPVGAAPVQRAAAAKARAALPDRSSKPPAAAPSGRCSRDRSAARGKAGKMGISTKHRSAAQHPDTALCTVLPPQPAPPAQLPLPNSDSPAAGAGCPGTPPTPGPPRSSSQGVSARSLLRPGHHAGRVRTRSAARRCPRSMTPVGCCCTGSRLLAALPSHGALRQRSG